MNDDRKVVPQEAKLKRGMTVNSGNCEGDYVNVPDETSKYDTASTDEATASSVSWE